MDWLVLWGNPVLLAAVGGLIAALRVAAGTSGKGAPAKAFDVVVAVLLAMGLAEYLTPAGMPRMSLVVGLIAGGVCDSALDAVRSLTPKAAGGLVDGWLGKLGGKTADVPAPVEVEPVEEEGRPE